MGFTVNVPMAAGATDADYLLAQHAVIDVVLDAFAPDLLLVSAGFDAHDSVPLGGMRVSTQGYVAVMQQLRALADRRCGGRPVFFTEGGYDLEELAACCSGLLECWQRRPRRCQRRPAPRPTARIGRSSMC